ncbi:MAG: SprT-like domain-containing protein [Bacteroidales bacterium]|nr:DUF45 domain-containing protein [Bacteroidales bacterium]
MAVHIIDDIPFTLIRCARRSVGLSVRPDGSVHVRAPLWLPERTIYKMMKERIPWIRARRQAAGKQIMIPPDGPELKKLKIAARERFMSLAAPWIERFEIRYGVSPLRWTLRDMNSRWGSCSMTTRRITLNLKLFHKPDECVEYVIVHELCHLLYPNHGKKFYELLSSELPDWKLKKKLLNNKII